MRDAPSKRSKNKIIFAGFLEKLSKGSKGPRESSVLSLSPTPSNKRRKVIDALPSFTLSCQWHTHQCQHRGIRSWCGSSVRHGEEGAAEAPNIQDNEGSTSRHTDSSHRQTRRHKGTVTQTYKHTGTDTQTHRHTHEGR